ncbi:MAG: hypothetical protein KAJ19_21625 [Gammaproteobacteria bacterium]|nr:hypothetical protein [Gammaproteobacteria bacterium]
MAIDSAKQKTDWIEAKRLRISEQLELVAFETLTAAGAVSIILPITYLDTTAGLMAITLANGYEGQVKTVVMLADNGDATLTPVNLTDGTQITFDDYDGWTGIFHAGSWVTLSGAAAVT